MTFIGEMVTKACRSNWICTRYDWIYPRSDRIRRSPVESPFFLSGIMESVQTPFVPLPCKLQAHNKKTQQYILSLSNQFKQHEIKYTSDLDLFVFAPKSLAMVQHLQNRSKYKQTRWEYRGRLIMYISD